MLVRIVRMTFKPEEVDAFLELFHATKDKIRNFEGCQHLELMQDFNHDNIFVTYSYWESEEHLNQYRFSPLFGEVWKATKAKFADKPVAFSSKKVVEV
ncbi:MULTISPECIES: antibiotic biosynthesis monooxygenase family protein [Roseivirga]|uniref:putative quinol monooxygenase n=1 Tax=Roseivirga TaxID=290180 RepID=UPI000D79A179|nr:MULTISPECIES: antibiotic biosynthesis monooxygenase family protein [Roseivirga]PWL27592.1 MAG: antibiotic biosynthesis monooxygenase [Roseivirga sp. XM-24bin3]MBO6662071.1 antibiotic biosynthesis monooxygenase [Roseivirga sp.]MBO6759627.1 antibiotic biosynthesis monooxygenase [Roseivirga sp.]MBO6909340.1 antibiotic biosynthesis monooxygenase [Roseivirga sp.]WPZ12339.1 antibiotic biosynthesis monooxygenase family protein [Roseivirga spongicola]